MSSQANQNVEVHFRSMIGLDMPEVMGINYDSFLYPWSEDELIERLKQKNCHGIVADSLESIFGFMVCERHPNYIRISKFAIHPDVRKIGVGKQMFEALAKGDQCQFAKRLREGKNRIVIEVRETNLAAQFFFSKCGFKAISTLREHFEDTSEDAYLMEYQLLVQMKIEHLRPI